MAISKVQFKESAEATPVVWMDTTDKTVDADKMVSGITALKNDGTTVTGNLASKSSSDLTASGATVTVPAGVYSSQASKAVSSGSATAPATISGSSATVSTGANTLTLSKTVSVTPTVSAGYVSSGTAGNSAVSLTASVNTRSSSDLTANTLTVTAPAGYYGSDATKTLTDANLIAGNIKKDISVFGVTGTYEGGGGSTTEEGTWTPAEDVAQPTINFANSHTGRPFCVVLWDASEETPTSNSCQSWSISSWYDLFGEYMISTGTGSLYYARVQFAYWSTSTSSTGTNITELTGNFNNSFEYYFTSNGFKPYGGSTSRYWRSGTTYKWIAVWKPTT